jgi:hypothetical protein
VGENLVHQNHAAGIASIELFVVRTISFKLLYGLVILRHARRRLVSIKVTDNPTAEWIAGQVTGAFPWDEAPRHLIRDRDGSFGPAYARRIRAMLMRDHPTVSTVVLRALGRWPIEAEATNMDARCFVSERSDLTYGLH